MILRRSLLTAAIACSALAAASPAQALKKISVHIVNQTNHTIHVEVAGADYDGTSPGAWYLGDRHTHTLGRFDAIDSEANLYGHSAWSSWARAYTKPANKDKPDKGCNVILDNPLFAYPAANFTLRVRSFPKTFLTTGYAAYDAWRYLGFAEDETYRFKYAECTYRVTRYQDGPDHKRFGLFFESVDPNQ